jgi:hypothetical protein
MGCAFLAVRGAAAVSGSVLPTVTIRYDRAVNHQSNFDYTRVASQTGGFRQVGYPDANPRGIPASISAVRDVLVLAAGIISPADLIKRLAGARDFRDFFCLPPVKENRAQPADPAPAVLTRTTKRFEVLYVDRFRKTE